MQVPLFGTVTLSLGTKYFLRPSLTLCPCTPPASSNPSAQASIPNPNFAAGYLVESCGLSFEDALRASKNIQHLKKPDKPDAVLRFLRETGMCEEDISTAVLKDARILCSSLEKNWRPNIAKLQQVGFSVKDISRIISHSPNLFAFNIATKVDFWLGILGSVENLSFVFKWNSSLLNSDLEKVVMPNLYFLREHCGLSASQIARLVKSYSRTVMNKPESLKMNANRAQELGFSRSSGMFMHALIVITQLSQDTFDARLNNLKRLGFSQEEVLLMFNKAPKLLGITEELIARKMEYLIKEAGCDKSDVIRSPVLLSYSFQRLIPRSTVKNLLMLKGLPVGNKALASFMQPTEEQFVETFIMPYEHVIPGLHRAYAGASAGND